MSKMEASTEWFREKLFWNQKIVTHRNECSNMSNADQGGKREVSKRVIKTSRVACWKS